MTEFYTVEISGKSYLVCREKPEGKGRPTLHIYHGDKWSPKFAKPARRLIEKAIVEARQ